MAKKQEQNAKDYIESLHMNGLRGRMLRIPAPKGKTRNILFVYGHHSSLERWWGVAQDLSQYGTVTMPDLPGFGGMQSFYKIGEKPTIDNLADYLAAFIKLRYKKKKVTIIGLSFGFVVVTRMLQRYPDLANKIDLLVSVVGFSHKDDFTFSRPRYLFYRWTAQILSYRLPAQLFKNICLHPLAIKSIYARTYNAKNKFEGVEAEEKRRLINFEIFLWRANDVRTHMRTTVEFLTLNNCLSRVDLPVWHVSVANDRYFDHHIVEQHMKIIFTKFHEAKSKLDNHAPSIIADMEVAKPLIPAKIRRQLSKS